MRWKFEKRVYMVNFEKIQENFEKWKIIFRKNLRKFSEKFEEIKKLIVYSRKVLLKY